MWAGLRRILAGEPRVCFLGDGVGGSWKIRGEQTASQRPHWRAMSFQEFQHKHIKKFDVFVMVKRFNRDLAEHLRVLGKLVVYDVVDPWKQPDDGLANPTLPQAIDFFGRFFAGMAMDGAIFPNRTMCEDLGSLVPEPVTIYHFYRPTLKPIEVRREVRCIGYEGQPRYLGEWRDVLENSCAKLGIQFLVNPQTIEDLDICVTARSSREGTLMPRRYKSNVKFANMLGAGLPCLAHADEMSVHETNPGGVVFFRDAHELDAGLESLLPWERRREISLRFASAAREFTQAKIICLYDEYFQKLISIRKQRQSVVTRRVA